MTEHRSTLSRYRRFTALLLGLFAAAEPTELKTIDDRVAEFGDIVGTRLAPLFDAAGVPYPPAAVTLIGLKRERLLEVHAARSDGLFRLVCTYPILAASGSPGPKLREGDRQVPEGIYSVPELNPNSLFHLALRLDYPNDFDSAHGAADGREDLGSDIMIHGDARSRGCLAMGDQAAEDLFVLAALTGIGNIRVILAPEDFRLVDPRVPADAPPWTPELYALIKRELVNYPAPQGSR